MEQKAVRLLVVQASEAKAAAAETKEGLVRVFGQAPGVLQC